MNTFGELEADRKKQQKPRGFIGSMFAAGGNLALAGVVGGADGIHDAAGALPVMISSSIFRLFWVFDIIIIIFHNLSLQAAAVAVVNNLQKRQNASSR